MANCWPIFRPVSVRKFNLSFLSRFIYTRNFLALDKIVDRQDSLRQSFDEKGVDVESVRSEIYKRVVRPNSPQSGDQLSVDVKVCEYPTLSQDISQYILTTRKSSDLGKAVEVLKAYVYDPREQSPAVVKRKRLLFKELVGLCHLHQCNEPVDGLMKDGKFMDQIGIVEEATGLLSPNSPAILTIYLDMLYKKGMYWETIELVDHFCRPLAEKPYTLLTLSLMSCLRLATPESYEKAKAVYHNDCPEEARSMSRIAHPYALQAMVQGQPTEALEVVAQVRRKSIVRSGILVSLYVRLGRISNALDVLDTVVRLADSDDSILHAPAADSEAKVVFSSETINDLVAAVEASNDKVTKLRLSTLFRRLDKVAAIAQKSLVDVVATPIDETRSMKYRRQKNRSKRLMADSPAMADDADEDAAEASKEEVKALSD